MVCIKCGNSIIDESKFCSFCGAVAEEETPAAETAEDYIFRNVGETQSETETTTSEESVNSIADVEYPAYKSAEEFFESEEGTGLAQSIYSTWNSPGDDLQPESVDSLYSGVNPANSASAENPEIPDNTVNEQQAMPPYGYGNAAEAPPNAYGYGYGYPNAMPQYQQPYNQPQVNYQAMPQYRNPVQYQVPPAQYLQPPPPPQPVEVEKEKYFFGKAGLICCLTIIAILAATCAVYMGLYHEFIKL